jgi:hypothetical protein
MEPQQLEKFSPTSQSPNPTAYLTFESLSSSLEELADGKYHEGLLCTGLNISGHINIFPGQEIKIGRDNMRW